jgi:NAD(P)-dependent dehydrogenase (short-subunit alcohol dehydrogenase family)
VTNPAQIQAAAEQVDSLDLLINNAGIWLYDDLSDRAMLEEHLAVNFYGTWGVTQAFLPLLTASCPGSRSRRSTGSTPTTGRGPWPSCLPAAPSCWSRTGWSTRPMRPPGAGSSF